MQLAAVVNPGNPGRRQRDVRRAPRGRCAGYRGTVPRPRGNKPGTASSRHAAPAASRGRRRRRRDREAAAAVRVQGITRSGEFIATVLGERRVSRGCTRSQVVAIQSLKGQALASAVVRVRRRSPVWPRNPSISAGRCLIRLLANCSSTAGWDVRPRSKAPITGTASRDHLCVGRMDGPPRIVPGIAAGGLGI